MLVTDKQHKQRVTHRLRTGTNECDTDNSDSHSAHHDNGSPREFVSKQKLILQLSRGFYVEIKWYGHVYNISNPLKNKYKCYIEIKPNLEEMSSKHRSTRCNVIYKSQSNYILFAAPFSSVAEIPIFLRVRYINLCFPLLVL